MLITNSNSTTRSSILDSLAPLKTLFLQTPASHSYSSQCSDRVRMQLCLRGVISVLKLTEILPYLTLNYSFRKEQLYSTITIERFEVRYDIVKTYFSTMTRCAVRYLLIGVNTKLRLLNYSPNTHPIHCVSSEKITYSQIMCSSLYCKNL